jgi:propanol-preferring alcohol dehydrogenase
MIGFRSLRKTGDARRVGIFGFGSAAVLITQVAVYQGARFMCSRVPGKIRSSQNRSVLCGLAIPNNRPITNWTPQLSLRLQEK